MRGTAASVVSVSILLASWSLPAAAGAARAWPTVERQLADAGAPPAKSALARLILANQDFSRLRADEARDELGLPPWLRVHWRRHHPEFDDPAADPSAVYPFALKELLGWMIDHPDLRPRHGAPVVRYPDPAKASAGGDLKVNPSVIGRSESDIRINPWSPSQVIAAANHNDGGFGGAQAQFFSTDGGATWGESALPLTGSDTVQADPSVDWTSDGRAWATTIGVVPSTQFRLRAYVSTDGGATWSFDGTPSGTQTAADKSQLWVDHSGTSPYRDTIYTCWHNGANTYVSRRTGSGWGAPIKVSGKETKSNAAGCHVMTNAAGQAFVFWPSTGTSKIHLARSTNGGATWGAPQTLASTFDSYTIGVPAFALRRALIYVASAAHQGSGIDDVYAAWTDLSGLSGCTGPAQEPGTNVASTCKTRIWFARSTNGGAAWSAPVRVNHQASLNDQFSPWLAVDATSGRLGLVYYDTVADAGRKKVHVYYQSSADRGVTWSAPLQVTTAPTDETTAGANPYDQFGDYNGLSAYLAKFLPIWTDRRSGGAEEVWTAPVIDP